MALTSLSTVLLLLRYHSWSTPRLVPFNVLNFSSFDRPGLRFREMPFMHKKLNWSVVASCCGTGGDDFSPDHVRRASQKFGLFTPGDECFGDKAGREHLISEWDYEFQVFTPAKFPGSPCVNLTMPTYASAPATRAQALGRMRRYFKCRQDVIREQTNQSEVMQLVCHYYYGALGAAMGTTNVVACEVGENGNSINAHCAHARE